MLKKWPVLTYIQECHSVCVAAYVFEIWCLPVAYMCRCPWTVWIVTQPCLTSWHFSCPPHPTLSFIRIPRVFFTYTSPQPRSFKNIWIPSSWSDFAEVVLPPSMRQVYHVTESGDYSFFLSPAHLTGPWWLSPKDTLSLPVGAVILHSPLWWTMQLDWGSLLCVLRVCMCVLSLHCLLE